MAQGIRCLVLRILPVAVSAHLYVGAAKPNERLAEVVDKACHVLETTHLNVAVVYMEKDAY